MSRGIYFHKISKRVHKSGKQNLAAWDLGRIRAQTSCSFSICNKLIFRLMIRAIGVGGVYYLVCLQSGPVVFEYLSMVYQSDWFFVWRWRIGGLGFRLMLELKAVMSFRWGGGVLVVYFPHCVQVYLSALADNKTRYNKTKTIYDKTTPDKTIQDKTT